MYQIFVSPLHRLTDYLQILMSIRDYGSCLSPLHLVIPTLFLNATTEKIYVHSFKVEPFCDLYGPDVDINTENSLDNSGSNETMQKVLASIVWLQRNFQKKIGGPKFRKSVFFIRFK